MKAILILCVVLISCNQESECDKTRRILDDLTRREVDLRDKKPEYNNTQNMALVRIEAQKAVLNRKLKTCEF